MSTGRYGGTRDQFARTAFPPGADNSERTGMRRQNLEHLGDPGGG